jgi:hypothetical protein
MNMNRRQILGMTGAGAALFAFPGVATAAGDENHRKKKREGVDQEETKEKQGKPMTHLYHWNLPSLPGITQTQRTDIKARASKIAASHRVRITGGAFLDQYFISPGTGYASSCYIRDATWCLEQADWLVDTADIRTMADWFLSKVLLAAYADAPEQYPAGSIPNAIGADGTAKWGPGEPTTMNSPTALTRRVDLDGGYYLNIMAWWYGKRLGFNGAWQTWFNANKATLELTGTYVPLTNGLVQQYSSHPAAVGVFSDTVAYMGRQIMTSIAACAAARAMSDMFGYVGDTAKQTTFATRASTIRAAIQASVLPNGHLPHTVDSGTMTDTVMCAEATALACSYGILTGDVLKNASAALVTQYQADKAAGGNGQLFCFTNGGRIGVRRQRLVDDYSPTKCWPVFFTDVWKDGNWQPKGVYENGGYWFWRIGSFAVALAATNPSVATEFLSENINACLANALAPYERSDYGTTGVNAEHLSSIITFIPQE